MRVFISVDIEGVTGLVSWSQCGSPDGTHFDYAFARQMMVHDVTAAVEGARLGGATHITIKDSHNSMKNLLISELPEDVEVVSGTGSAKLGMMDGLDASFDAAMLVGYHGMAGTQGGIMEHTLTGTVHRLWINEREAGEIALSVGLAGSLNLPVVMVSSDRAGCAEASALVSGIATAEVKTGFGRGMGKVLHPSKTGPLIRNAAQQGLRSAALTAPWRPSMPLNVKIEFNKTEEADAAGSHISFKRLNGYTIESTFNDFVELNQAIWNVLDLGAHGRQATN